VTGSTIVPDSAKTDPLTKWSERADKADKIYSFLAKVATLVGAALYLAYGWLKDVALILTRLQLMAIVAVLAVIGAVFALLAYRRRRLWSRWGVLATSVASGLFFGLGFVLWYVAPVGLQWQRIDVPAIARVESFDLPMIIMRDHLLARNNLAPGGNTYLFLVQAKRGTETVAEQWAGYYAPLAVISTLPRSVSLKSTGALNGANASLGVYVFVWNVETAQFRVPRTFGYDALHSSVTIDTMLKRNERAAVMVFVYPWTLSASKNLPDDMFSAVSIE
jgi:hypothetical protein